MTDAKSSYRQILRSSSIVGGASAVNIVIGLVRTKVAAMLLGPAGIGAIGLLTNLMNTASILSGLGFGNVGTRQIAEAVQDADARKIAAARRAISWGTAILAVIGALLVWLFRTPISSAVFESTRHSYSVGWISLGVAFTVVSASQVAVLRGHRRVGDIARVTVFGAALTTGVGVPLLLLYDEKVIAVFVILAPLASAVVAHIYVRRLPKLEEFAVDRGRLFGQWKALVSLGFAFMAATLISTFGQMAVRVIIQRRVGLEEVGLFQASMSISFTYIAFVLGAMGTDFYPRLAGIMNKDPVAANRLINQQTQVALLLAAPALVAMLGLAPWVIELLYTDTFRSAALILRWQVLGDLLRVISWPLGFAVLASGDGRAYLLAESAAMLTFLGVTYLTLPLLGIEGSGLGAFAMYLVYAPLAFALVRRRSSFSWDRRLIQHVLTVAIVIAAVFLISDWQVWFGAVAAMAASGLFGLHALMGLGELMGSDSAIGRIAARCRKVAARVRLLPGYRSSD